MVKTKSTLRKRPSTIRGRGDYSSSVKSIRDPASRLEAKIDHLEQSINKKVGPLTIKTGAGVLGRTLGNFMGQGDLGALAGESLAKYFGHGDYTVKSNSLMASSVSGSTVPKFSSNGKRGTRIVEREYLCDVFSGALSGGSSVFSNTSYVLNPTDRNTFPWLSSLASKFDQWEPHGLVFEFISTSSTFNGTSQALGTVILSTDYDSADAAYASKQVMENADYSCSTRPSENLLHGIECEPKERPLQIMYTDVRASTPQFSSLGNFQIATTGCSTASARLGELWVSYDITLYKKQLTSTTSDIAFYNAKGTSAVGTGLLSLPTSVNSSGIFVTQNVGVGSVINFPPSQGEGFYYIDHYLTDFRGEAFAGWTYTNCTLLSSTFSGSALNTSSWRIYVQLTGPGATITTSLKLTIASTWNVYITESPPNLTVVAV